MLLYLAADLLWASKIKGTADALSLPCRPVRSVEMLEARLADSPVTALLVDLDKPEEAMTMIGRLRGAAAGVPERSIRILAFGPHVAKEALAAAKAAGADEVLPRGAFDHDMGNILKRLSAKGG
ncbi:MAG: hypothetical protein AABZ53_03495 [Planctomycetota bacterium]